MVKTTLGRRGLSLFLTLVMCLTMAPAVFAAGETLTMSQQAATLDVGGTVDLTVTESGIADFDKSKVVWTSSDEKIATVNGGTVTAVAPGTATITASYTIPAETPDPDPAPGPGPTTRADTVIEATCNVTVTDNLTGMELKLDETELELVERDVQELTAILTPIPADATISSGRVQYEWRTDNENVAAVAPSRDGTKADVTARNEGTAKITVTARYKPLGKDEITATATCLVGVAPKMDGIRLSPSGPLILETSGRQSRQDITATPNPPTAAVTWKSSDSSVAQVGTSAANGQTATITGRAPGIATVTATIGADGNTDSADIEVEVSGIKLVGNTSITVRENSDENLPVIERYGAAKSGSLSFQSANTNIAVANSSAVMGRGPGTTTITVYAGANYQATFTVTVEPDAATTIGPVKNFKTSDTLSFGDYISNFRGQVASGNLSHLTGVRVDPAQGTLYYRYNTADGPEGVAQSTNYYYNAFGNQKSMSDITFVPNPNYTGTEVTINYTVVSDTYQSTNGRIILELEKSQASNEIYLSGTHSYPAQFSSEDFNRICQQNYGAALNYVTFSLPASSQGTLYTDYVSEEDYGSKVTTGTRYRRQELDKVFFVPSEGFSGTTTVYYTARAVGTPGATYSGQVIISVSRDSGQAGEKLVYECSAGGYVTLDDARFNDYWRNEMKGSGNLNYIRFDALPSASQGTLYYRYRSASNTGSAVQTGTNYYYGSYNPRLDSVSFAADKDFSGVVYIPFTGYTDSGDRFSGRIEIDVTGTGGSGSVWYPCRPGRTVDFSVSDFNRLSSSLTGRDVDFIKFQDLPNSSTQGSLYYNSSRVTSTSRNYYRSGGTYQIRNLSFRAASSFSGSVNIPFTGRSANGINFDGTLTISSDGSGNWDSNIYYSTDYSAAAVFDRDDFDELSQLESDRNVSTVWFTDLPSETEGSLYRNYYSSSSKGSRITSNNTSISASSLDRVAFIPASGFTGTVYLPFRARSASGDDFYGTVQVDVGRPSADVTARYYTWTSPVNLRSQDLRRSTASLNYIRFTALPSASEGRLFYRYTSPTQYERQALTGTSYYASGSSLISDLAFVPRAGYTGTVYIPYTGTNTNGTTFEGEIAISVSPSNGSNHFSDMGQYSGEARAAVDYLYNLGVTKGISSTQFGPELNISRADFAVMVYNAFGLSSSGSYQVFSDVPAGAYYSQAVNALYNRGIVGGTGNGMYSPSLNVSRQDAVCMVHRAMRSIGWSTGNGNTSLLDGYSDGRYVSDYARSDMANAIWRGYLPTANGRLDYNSPLTRVDMAQILHRVLTY